MDSWKASNPEGKARENCAVFGIYAPERDVSRISYTGDRNQAELP